MQDNLTDVDSFSAESSCKSASKASTLPSVECVKRGSTKAYQTNAENINMLQKTDPDKKFRSSFNAGDQIDNVLSGESLYKTFTFEQSSNEEDVEKCIAFWKGVMQKNLEPIKCSIIEGSKAKEPQEKPDKRGVISQEKHFEEISNAEAKIHEYYKNMWNSTLEEIQRRKLNEIKLIGKSRCKMCETQLSDTEIDSSVNRKEIEELNTWEPKPGKIGSTNRFGKRKKSTATAESSQKSVVESLQKSVTCTCDPVEKAEDTVSVDTVVLDHVHVPRDTNRYKLIDVIGQKKKDGSYTKWREGTAKPCTCGVAVCDCNKNPAIISMTQKSETCGCGLLKCRCMKTVDVVEKQEDKDSLKEPEEEQPEEDLQEVYVENCACGNEHCTCDKLKKRSTESIATLEMLLLAKESEETKSVDTIIIEVGQEIPPNYIQLDVGPVKKDSKADVTKSAIGEHESNLSLEIGKSPSDTGKCVCKEVCTCEKTKTEEKVENGGKKEVLQLQKSNKK